VALNVIGNSNYHPTIKSMLSHGLIQVNLLRKMHMKRQLLKKIFSKSIQKAELFNQANYRM